MSAEDGRRQTHERDEREAEREREGSEREPA